MNPEHLKYLHTYHFDNKKRLGKKKDGGYVIANLDTKYDCYLNCGVGREDSFTIHFLKANPYINYSDRYAFDGTIKKYPKRFKDIQFIRKNIGTIDSPTETNMFNITEQYNNIFLSMDIEGGEYQWILTSTKHTLKKIAQITIEFHGICDDSWGTSYEDKILALRKLTKTHYIVHVHANNFAPVVNGIPTVIEVTYVNKKFFTEEPPLNKTPLPLPGLDFPNDKLNPDVPLDIYPFLH